jgi:putative ABC transport system permease protein
MSFFTQVFAVSWLSLKTIPQRLGSSAVAVVGIAGVVIVFVAVLSMAQGFYAAMTLAGSPDRALVLRTGADDEMTSGLGGPEADIIKEAPGIRHDGARVLAAPELFVLIDLPKISTGTPANVPMRGIDPASFGVREESSSRDGRWFGTNVVVGRAAARQYVGPTVGPRSRLGSSWTVVGAFESRGSVAETEIWCDARFLQGLYRRGNTFQSVRVRLDSPASYTQFKDWLTTNPQLNVSVKPEVEYYMAQSVTLTRLIRSVGFGIAILMGIGAVFGAILTMYTAVSTRTREIATLRALGFNTASVLISVLVESFGLAAIGGALGGLLAFLGFNGYQTSTMNFQTFSQVAFAFAVTPWLLLQGLGYALMMGVIGGLLPAVRAARLPISSALREL